MGGENMDTFDVLNNSNDDIDIDKINSEIDDITSALKSDEYEIEAKIRETDELSELVGKAIKDKLKNSLNREGNGSGHIIFADTFPDILSAQARLLSLSVDGRCKVAAIRKNRYSILKSKISDDNKKSELSLSDIL